MNIADAASLDELHRGGLITMGEYEDTIKDIEKNLGMVPGFIKEVPKEPVVQHWPLFKKYTLGESRIPAKYRDLIGLAIAANLKCTYSQLFHESSARLRGATDEEIAEAAFLASYTAGWSDIMQAQHYDYDTFADEVPQKGKPLKGEQMKRTIRVPRM